MTTRFHILGLTRMTEIKAKNDQMPKVWKKLNTKNLLSNIIPPGVCPSTKRPPLNRRQNSTLDSVFKLNLLTTK